MSADPQTLAVYDAQAGDYAARFGRARPGRVLQRFIDALPKGARVLDLGCGPGTASRHMQAAGLAPDPVDASASMVTLACEAGLPARQMQFDQLNARADYQGVWANFSLLHAPRAAFPLHLDAITRAMCPGGLLHFGMKLGKGEARDTLGRFYTYYSEEALTQALVTRGYRLLARDVFVETGLAGTPDEGITLLARLSEETHA